VQQKSKWWRIRIHGGSIRKLAHDKLISNAANENAVFIAWVLRGIQQWPIGPVLWAQTNAGFIRKLAYDKLAITSFRRCKP
jgi:hypothetical protein